MESPLNRIHAAPAVAVLALGALVLAACDEADEGPAGITVSEVGFSTPESVQHDPAGDLYLVSNINGGPLERNGAGFISRLSPEGEVLELRWIDGETEGVTLHAPKGLAIHGETVFVADIDCVRMFDRESGEPTGEVCLEDATFLNGIAVDEDDGILYVTDSGLEEGEGPLGFAPSGTDAVYQITIADGEASVFAEGEELGHPNGISVSRRGLMVVSFGTGAMYRFDPAGQRLDVIPESDRQMDGLKEHPDGGFLFSDWSEGAVFRIQADGALSIVAEGLEAPADIGYDVSRDRVLIPLFMEDAVLLRDLGPGAF